MSFLKSTIASWLGLGGLDSVVTYLNSVMNGSTDFTSYSSDEAKLKVILSNPAALKVFALQCDLFSLGKVYVYKNGKVLDTDPFLNMIKKPNPFQRQSQFLWDYMFFNMLGNSYCYVDSKIISDTNKLYILENNKIVWPANIDKYRDRIVLSNSLEKEINEIKLEYCQSGGSNFSFTWDNIIHVPD